MEVVGEMLEGLRGDRQLHKEEMNCLQEVRTEFVYFCLAVGDGLCFFLLLCEEVDVVDSGLLVVWVLLHPQGKILCGGLFVYDDIVFYGEVMIGLLDGLAMMVQCGLDADAVCIYTFTELKLTIIRPDAPVVLRKPFLHILTLLCRIYCIKFLLYTCAQGGVLLGTSTKAKRQLLQDGFGWHENIFHL